MQIWLECVPARESLYKSRLVNGQVQWFVDYLTILLAIVVYLHAVTRWFVAQILILMSSKLHYEESRWDRLLNYRKNQVAWYGEQNYQSRRSYNNHK